MLKYTRLWTAVGWGLVLLVVYLSLVPNPPAPVTFDHADKLEHALAYAALSFWFCHLHGRLRVIIALVGLGIALEYVQGWTGYRSFDVLDMLADGVGVLAGALLELTPLGKLLSCIECRLAR
jgi:VanZ family protein